MKKFFSIIGLILVIQTLNAQTKDFLSTKNLWSVITMNSYMNSYSESTQRIKIGTDTIINDLLYKKVWRNYTENDESKWYCNSFIRDDNGKVFYLEPDYKEYQLYDFNSEVGDTFTTFSSLHTQSKVTIDSIFYSHDFGDSVKTWKVGLSNRYSGEENFESYWYEGIGSEFGLLFTGEIVLHSSKYLLCFSYDDSLIYRMDGYQECFVKTGLNESKVGNDVNFYPNPADDFVKINTTFRNYHLKITSLTGREVYNRSINDKNALIDISSLKQGIYILILTHDNAITTKRLTKK